VNPEGTFFHDICFRDLKNALPDLADAVRHLADAFPDLIDAVRYLHNAFPYLTDALRYLKNPFPDLPDALRHLIDGVIRLKKGNAQAGDSFSQCYGHASGW